MNSPLTPRLRAVAATLVLATALAGCGGDKTDTETDHDAMPGMTTTSHPDGHGAQPFGAGCSAIPKSGAGSFEGMSNEPVATAASANPLLTTLVAAVKEAGLVDTLNSTDAYTVFAPTDEAFAKIPKDQLDALLANKAQLTKVLTHHVVERQLNPMEVIGEHRTLAKDIIDVEGDESGMTVGEANVVCGNIHTSNATVYVIDTVLMP